MCKDHRKMFQNNEKINKYSTGEFFLWKFRFKKPL